VGRYLTAYKALLQLDPTGDWQERFLELKDRDNRGPGKEADEEGVGDGSYFRSWIWLSNPRVPDTTDGEVGEEGASEEDINEILRVEWTTSFARLARWSEEVDLLQEEMRRVVAFLEWRSREWSAKVDVRSEDSTSDVQSGLSAYARKQAAIYHGLAVSFTKLWHPTLVSYDLQHSWATKYLMEHGVSLTDTPVLRARGIFKFRISGKSRSSVPTPSDLPAVEETASNLLLEEADSSDDSGWGDSDSASEINWDDDLDF